jgi:general secretion pathway protein I
MAGQLSARRRGRRCPEDRRRSLEGGFSLLEVLVAFSVLALTLGVLIQVFSLAMRTTTLSGAYSRAAALAEARLNAVGVDIPLQVGAFGGEPEDGMNWQVVIAPYDTGQTGWQAPVQPYVVTATAQWEEAGQVREVVLSTLRIGKPL